MTCLFWGPVVELIRKMVSSETDACPRHSFYLRFTVVGPVILGSRVSEGNFFDHRQVVPAGDGGQPRAMPRRRVCWMILARHTTRGYLPSRSQTHLPQYTSDKGRVLAISVSYTRKLQYAALGDAELRSCPASICRVESHSCAPGFCVARCAGK